MKKYILIGIGGALGASCRYLIKGLNLQNYSTAFPINTLIINITGSFVLALILTIAFEIWEFDTAVRLGIATGFLGAYTTFSSLCKETAALILNGPPLTAFAYIAASVGFGLSAVYLGIVLAREAVAKLTHAELVFDEDIYSEEEGGA